MARRRGWKDCYEYKRIIEILNDYWGTEPDEDLVRVEMAFLKSNGESQRKCILWRNPNTEEGRKDRINSAWALRDSYIKYSINHDDGQLCYNVHDAMIRDRDYLKWKLDLAENELREYEEAVKRQAKM
jgi:hypothetical protein